VLPQIIRELVDRAIVSREQGERLSQALFKDWDDINLDGYDGPVFWAYVAILLARLSDLPPNRMGKVKALAKHEGSKSWDIGNERLETLFRWASDAEVHIESDPPLLEAWIKIKPAIQTQIEQKKDSRWSWSECCSMS
jgi:hypothetical protein